MLPTSNNSQGNEATSVQLAHVAEPVPRDGTEKYEAETLAYWLGRRPHLESVTVVVREKGQVVCSEVFFPKGATD